MSGRIFVDGSATGAGSRLEECLEEVTGVCPHIYVVMDRVLEGKVELSGKGGLLPSQKVEGVKFIEASESLKTLDTVMEICAWLLEKGADRDALVLAVGGGITTDMAGFAASIYKRGVRFAFVPTTLLAQVDAAISGKNGVNFENYKNMLGVIRQPVFTLVCPSLLRTLPFRDFLSGAAEMLKTFVIEGPEHYERAADHPVSILKVSTDCSCLKAFSDKSAVLPGKYGTVSADYYTENHFGKFERRIFVYSSSSAGRPSAVLYIRASVTDENESEKEK